MNSYACKEFSLTRSTVLSFINQETVISIKNWPVELIDLKVTWKKNYECNSFCNSRWPHGVHAGREAWARDLAPIYSTGAFCILNVEI